MQARAPIGAGGSSGGKAGSVTGERVVLVVVVVVVVVVVDVDVVVGLVGGDGVGSGLRGRVEWKKVDSLPDLGNKKGQLDGSMNGCLEEAIRIIIIIAQKELELFFNKFCSLNTRSRPEHIMRRAL